MSTLKQLAHPHTVSASRTLLKSDLTDGKGDEAREKAAIAQLLAEHIAKKRMAVSVDGESINYALNLIVLTHDELEALVEGLNQAKPTQGELYAGDDAQAG